MLAGNQHVTLMQKKNVDPDISPAMSQPVTPASDMADSHYAMWQKQTVATQRFSLHTGGGSHISAASNFFENHSYLLITAVKKQKNRLTQVEK